MLRRLHIEQFRGLDTLDIDLQAVNVLLGPNSCGKSSVLHAIRLACSALTWTLQQDPEPKVDGEWIVIWWDWPVNQNETFLPPMPTPALFLNHGDKPVVIHLQFDDTDFVQELRIRLRYGRSEALRLDVRVKSRHALDAVAGFRPKSKNISPTLASAIKDNIPTAITVPSFYGVIKDEVYVNDARLALLLGAGEQGRVVRNLIGRLPSTKTINDFLMMAVGSNFTNTTSGQKLQSVENLTTYYRDSNGELELSSAGTGFVALAALYAALSWYSPFATLVRPLLFLLDEPEAHLHPKLQGRTGEKIADLITAFGAQAVIATHSVEMINRLGLRSDTVLLGVDRNASQPVIRLTTENEVIERLESFCDLSPFTSLNLLRTRKILFHEGKTDRIILECCAKALFANAPQRLERFFQWSFVELSGATNAGAKDILKKALEPLASIRKDGQPLYIVRILDPDHYREAAMGPEEGTANIKEFDAVWSGYSIESLFLEPACLSSWLSGHLRARPGAPDSANLERIVSEAIISANTDADLIRDAAEQIFLQQLRKINLGQLGSDKVIIDARREAEARVKKDPSVYQHGKRRAKHILDHIRNALPEGIRNRVRGDVTDVLKYAPSPSSLVAPSLIPPEIARVLDYMANVP